MRTILKPALHIVPLTAACLLLSAPLVHAQSPQYLTIGDAAPVLKPAKWLKGTPIPQFEKGKLYVVEFWATWCGPCKENIPHLTELAKKYKDQVSIVGVSIWENAKGGEGDYIKKVESFVKEKGATMDYNVAVDGPKGDIADSWMKPAGEGGIPCSFIVDKDGKIAWIGHPAKMEETLQQVIAGTYDAAPVREKRETQMRLLRPIEEAMAAKNYSATATAVEKALDKKPELIYSLAHTYLVALYHADLNKGIAVSRKIVTDNKEIGAYQLISSIFATQDDLSPAAYKFGIGMIDEALQNWPEQFMFKAMKADVFFRTGDKAQAITLAQETLDFAQSQPNVAPEALALIKKNLARYKAAK